MNVNDKAALTVAIDEFDEFFAAVNHGREPYAWQRALLRQVVTTGRWPDAVVAPTGAGKSSVLEVHVFAVAMTHAPGWEGARAPRRLWHVVGRRALVDDMASRAEAVFGQLAETTRWTAILTIVVQVPRNADRLRANPLGIYVNAINWSRELGQ